MYLTLLFFCIYLFSAQYHGQYIQQPQQSSSIADSNTVSNEFNLGKLFGISNTATRAEAVTKNVYDGYNAQQKETNNVYRNSLNIAGIPISNTIKTTNAMSNSPTSRNTGAIEETFNLGRLGLTAGLTNERSAGPLIGLVRGHGGAVNLNLGGLSFGVGPSNVAPYQLDHGAGVQAVGTGSSSNVNTNTMDRQQTLGPIQLHMSKSQTVAQASTYNGYSGAIGANSQHTANNNNNYYSNNQQNDYNNQAYNPNYQYDYHNLQNGYYQQQYQYQNTPNQHYNQPHYQQPGYYTQPQHPYHNPIMNPFTVSRGSFNDVQSSTVTVPSLQSTEQMPDIIPTIPAQKADSSVPNNIGENLDVLISNVFTRTEVPLEPAAGKSLAELLSEQKTKSESDEPGAEFGLDVRSEERRRRSVVDIDKTMGGHRVRRNHDHYHNHHSVKSQHHGCHHSHIDDEHLRSDHNGERSHSHYKDENVHSHYNNERSHSHHDDEHSHHDDEHSRSQHSAQSSNSHHEDDGLQTHNKPPTSFSPTKPNRRHQTGPTASEQDPNAVFNIDIRSDFESRRKRDVGFRYPRDDTIVFQAGEEKTFEEKLAAMTPDATSTPTGDNMDDTTETSGDEEENGELNSRFGFIGGQRRRPQRPLAGLFSGLVGGAFNSIGNSGMLERGFDQYGRPVQQPYYSQQPQYPQEYPQQYPNHNPQPYLQQQYPQLQYPQDAVHQRQPGFGGGNNHQTAGANTQSQNYQNEFGQYQNNAGSSQSANLAADGSSGQLSAANTQQQNFQNEFGAGSKNSGQSQSANFDGNGNLALTSSNSNTQHTSGPNGVRDEANSGAQSNVKNQFGTSSSGAQSDTTNFNENGKFGQQSHGSSQSTFLGNDGSLSGSNSDATSGTFVGPFGLKGQQSSSHSSSFNNGGVGNTGVSASAGSGTGFGGAQSESFGGINSAGGGGAQSSAGTNSFNNQPGYQSYEGLPVFG